MPHKTPPRSCLPHALRLGVIALILGIPLAGYPVEAQGIDPLAQQLAEQRVEFERIAFLPRLQQISSAEARERRKQWNSAVTELRAQIVKQPRDQQAQIMQQAESLFQVRIVPLREEWRQKLLEKRQSDAARDAQIQRELVTDAEKAGTFQADRALLREKQQRGEISQAELERHDQVAEQEVLALQRKYDGYGSNWGQFFSQHMANSAQKITAEVRLKGRLEDTQSEIGQDAHRAAELNLSIQRNAVLRMRQAITRPQEEEQNATLKAQLSAIKAKYAAGSTTAPDFRDRVRRLVPAGATERRAQWESEADAARAALTRNARANVAPATSPQRRPQPYAVPAQTYNTADAARAALTRNAQAKVVPATPPHLPPQTSALQTQTHNTYLREMPSAETVLADIRGKSRLDTAQRQIVALMTLDHMIALMQPGGEFGRGTAEEQALRSSYRGAIPPINASFDPVESKQLHLYWQDHLEGSSTIERELLKCYFSPEWQAKYYGIKANKATGLEAINLGIKANLATHAPTRRTSDKPPDGWLALLLLLPAGIVGYYFYRGHRAAVVPSYSDLRGNRPMSSQANSQPPITTPPTRTASSIPSAVSSLPATATLKERKFAEQKETYQARYNDAVDELTQATTEIGVLGNVPAGVQANLKLLSERLESRVEALLEARLKLWKVAQNAAIIMPLWRLLKRAGVLLIIIIALGALAILWWSNTLLEIEIVDVAILYIAVFTICFFIERRMQLKKPLELLKTNSNNLKALSLTYIYDDQDPELENMDAFYHAVRISTANENQTFEEIRKISKDPRTGPGTYLLVAGTLAAYRLNRNGDIALTSDSPQNEFMQNYGSLLTQALTEQNTFVPCTLAPLAEYGQGLWRKRKISAEVPRLGKLLRDVEGLETLWRDTYVANDVFGFLLRRIDLFNIRDSASPPGILLYGYPGNGKTHIARKIAESVSARFEQVNPATLSSPDEVKAFWEKSLGNDPVVLFVEYGERVFPRPRSENEGAGTREATLAWLTEWGKHEPRQSRTWVIVTAQSEQDLHPDMLMQFGGSKVEIRAPDTAGRELILRNACRDNQLADELPGWLANSTGGASIRELRDIVKETKLQSVPNPPTDSHWREAVKSVRGSDAAFKDETKTWDRLVLPADIKEQLQRACRIIREAERYKEKKVNVPNILLFGPPGTGKTDIARTFANEGNIKFFMATTADMKAQYVGQSAPLVRSVFSKARASAPAVLFIDEIETVAAKRGSPMADSFTQDVVTEMLAQMDGARKYDRPVFVLAATNLPEQIDPAILSRFTSKIEIPLPDEAARCEILKRLISERTVDPELDVEEISALLSKRTARKSGRDLVMLVNRAMERAVLVTDSPEDVRLTRELLMAEVSPQGKVVSEAEMQKVWAQIVLKQEVKDSILSKVRLFNRADKAAPRGMLLYGPPGTGKTEIARRIADSCSSHFMSLTGSDLKAGFIGQTGQQVKAIWEKARAHGRCVMFIDECEGVFARRGGINTDSFAEEGVREFIAMWDGVASEGQVWVIGATNRRDLLDDAAMSRFGAALEIGLPDAAERLEILRLELRKLERVAVIPDFVGRATTGFSGRTLSRVASDLCAAADERGGAITADRWREVIASHTKSTSDVADENARWDTLVLSDDTMQQLQSVCEALHSIEMLQKQGIQPPRGALLFGPPGTGKTQIARTLANESGLAFIAAGPSDMKASFAGQTVQKVRDLFDRARSKAPCILFIDEIDVAAAARGSAKADQVTEDAVTELLTQMDGVKKTDRHVFVLAATNLPESVDSAIVSRFTYKIEILNPTLEQRQRLFTVFLRQHHRIDFDIEATAAEMARRCGDIGGRDIQSLVRRAEQQSLRHALERGTADQVILRREDLMAELAPKGREVSEAEVQKAWAQIVLKPDVKESILSKLHMFNNGDPAAPRGLLLYGPPGTGKTEIARRIAQSTSSFFLSLTTADLKGGYIGQSGQNVKAAWEKARAHGRCVMFVDECEGVLARRGGVNTDSFQEELVREFLAKWDGVGSKGQIWVVGATNRRDQLDEAIVSRFGAAVEIGLPEAQERLQILHLEMQKLERSEEILAFVGRATTGFSGRDLSQVARDVCTIATERKTAITPEMWKEVIARYAKASSESVDESARWDSLVLSQSTIEKLQTICETLRQIEALKKQGIEPPRGALLYGPPGTGKTQIARTLANESGLPFIAAGPSDIKAGFVGQSGQKVHELFERARSKAPCILFIDEIDSGASARGGAKADQFTDEIVTQMLTELDGVKKNERHVFLLAATNRPDLVDEAILSRFVDKIEIPKPDVQQRKRLLQILLGKKHLDFDVAQCSDELARRMGDISGRDIYSLIERASQKALQRALKADKVDEVTLKREDLISQLSAT